MFAFFREMCVWDLQEGQCLETVKMSFIHRQIEVSELVGDCALSDTSKNMSTIFRLHVLSWDTRDPGFLVL